MKIRTVALGVLLLLEKGIAVEPERIDVPQPGLILESRPELRSFEFLEPSKDLYFRMSYEGRETLSKRLIGQLQPSRVMTWDMTRTNLDFSLVGPKHVANAFGHAGREIFAEMSLDSTNWFVRIIKGIVANTDEEEVREERDLGPNYNLDTWLRRPERDKISFGARPGRTDPYVYVSGPLGHYEGQRLVDWLLRYRARDLMDHRIETFFSVRLPESISLQWGMVYEVLDNFMPVGKVHFGTLRLEKWFGDRGSFTVGYNLRKSVLVAYDYHF